jgi:hypothetical protein
MSSRLIPFKDSLWVLDFSFSFSPGILIDVDSKLMIKVKFG